MSMASPSSSGGRLSSAPDALGSPLRSPLRSARRGQYSSPATLTEIAERNKALVASSRELCATLTTRVDQELQDSLQSIINDFPEAVTRNESSLKSAVGIVLKGCVIDFFLPGAPASRVLRKGDEIVEIDGVPCNEHSAADMLIGCDIPGSSVTIRYRSSASSALTSFLPDTKLQTLSLKRLSSDMVADRRNMLDLLRSLKVGAVERGDNGTGAVVDKTMDLWRKMLMADEALRNRTSVAAEQVGNTIKDVVHKTTGMLNELQALGDLDPYANDLERLQSAYSLTRSEADSLREECATQSDIIQARDTEIADLQRRLRTVSAAHKGCDDMHDKQRRRLGEVEEARALLSSTLEGTRAECATSRSRAVELGAQVQQLEHELDQQRNMFQQCEEDLHQRTLMLAKADARILALLQDTDADKAATQGKHLTAVQKLDERAQALTAANMALQQAVAAANMEAEEMRTTLGKNASALSGMRDELSHERSNLASAETMLAQARADAASSSSGLQSKVRELNEQVKRHADANLLIEELRAKATAVSNESTAKHKQLIMLESEKKALLADLNSTSTISQHRKVSLQELKDSSATQIKKLQQDLESAREANERGQRERDALAVLQAKAQADLDLAQQQGRVSEQAKSVAQAALADALRQLLSAKSDVEQERHKVAEGALARESLAAAHAEQVARLQEHISDQHQAAESFIAELQARDAKIKDANEQLLELIQVRQASAQQAQAIETLTRRAEETTSLLALAREQHAALLQVKDAQDSEVETLKEQLRREESARQSAQQAKEDMLQELRQVREILTQTSATLRGCQEQQVLSSSELVAKRTGLQQAQQEMQEVKEALVSALAHQARTAAEADAHKAAAQKLEAELRALGIAHAKLKDAVEKGVQDLERQRVLFDETQRHNASTQSDNLLLHKELQDLRIQMNGEIEGLKETKQSLDKAHAALLTERNGVFEEFQAARHEIALLTAALASKEEALEEEVAAREELAQVHSACYRIPTCGIGVSLWDPHGEGKLEIREIAAGGSCWIETRLSSHKVLPQVGDEVRMINNRLVSSQDMAAGLLLGNEGSQVELIIDKADGSGIYTVFLTRRVQFKPAPHSAVSPQLNGHP